MSDRSNENPILDPGGSIAERCKGGKAECASFYFDMTTGGPYPCPPAPVADGLTLVKDALRGRIPKHAPVADGGDVLMWEDGDCECGRTDYPKHRPMTGCVPVVRPNAEWLTRYAKRFTDDPWADSIAVETEHFGWFLRAATEIAALRAEVERLRACPDCAHFDAYTREKARADRLAEALREIIGIESERSPAKRTEVERIAVAALKREEEK